MRSGYTYIRKNGEMISIPGVTDNKSFTEEKIDIAGGQYNAMFMDVYYGNFKYKVGILEHEFPYVKGKNDFNMPTISACYDTNHVSYEGTFLLKVGNEEREYYFSRPDVLIAANGIYLGGQ